jgi:integrase
MATIKKLPNGTYQARIYTGRDANGKQLFKYITKSGWKEIKTAARNAEQELEEGRLINIENIRVVEWIKKWIDLKTFSPSTRATYKSYIKNHYLPYFGKLKLKQLNEIHLKKFMAEESKEVSQASVRRMTSVLKSALYDAMKHRSPARDLKLPQEEKYIPRVPTDLEMEAIHETVKGTRDELIVLLAAWCGLRRGEIFALKWNDINWKKGTVRVDESYAINEDNLYEDKRPKSENGLREIVIDEYLLSLLDSLRKTKFRGKKKESEKEDTSGHRIFNLRPDSFSSYWAEFVRRKGLPRIRFHDLRHYHASWLYDNEISDQYAAERLGHDIKILKGIYQHIGKDRQEKLDEKMRNLRKGKDQKNEQSQG